MKQLPIISKIIFVIGALIFLLPGLFFLIAHIILPAIPERVGFLTEVLASVIGFAICLLGIIPALRKANRSE